MNNRRQWLPTPGNALLTLLLFGLLLWGKTPGTASGAATSASASATTIAFQGFLVDASQAPLSGDYDITFRLYNTAAGGAPIWQEEWAGANVIAVAGGRFVALLGSLTPIPLEVLTSNALYLGVAIGGGSELAPRTQVASVPFAMQALTVPDGAITRAKLPDGVISGDKIDPDMLIHYMAQSVPVAVSGSRPNYSFELGEVRFPAPFPHKTIMVTAWLNVPGTHLGVAIAQPWAWSKDGFAVNSRFYCDCDISTATLGYTAVGY